ncbi:MAG: endonuclease [Saprospiraceae bacterium]|nr:endonuclease [Saprospiraceae bacterium]
MNKLILIKILCLVSIKLSVAQYQQDVLPNLTGQTLIDSLVAQYKPDSVLNYGEAKDTLIAVLHNVNDTVTCVYTGLKLYVDPTQDPSTYVFDGGNVNGINTEHTFPRSKGANSGNPKGDLHHLFPTRAGTNSARGNSPFANIQDTAADEWFYLDQEYDTIPPSPIDLHKCSKRISGVSFEPPHDHKGDVARAMFYFYTMYRTEADAADPSFFSGMRAQLCEWHIFDPVDAKEWNRNLAIAPLQSNQPNPFILDCTLVKRAYCSDITDDCVAIANPVQKNTQYLGVELINNYPNPVSAQTNIRYYLSQTLEVKLKIYDLFGKEVTSLVDATQDEGEYSYVWNRKSIPAGVYFYRLTVENGKQSQSISQKMIVID